MESDCCGAGELCEDTGIWRCCMADWNYEDED